jgi:hypothetical protein
MRRFSFDGRPQIAFPPPLALGSLLSGAGRALAGEILNLLEKWLRRILA